MPSRQADMYRLSTFEPLPNLHLGISKMLNESLVAYVSSDGSLTAQGHTPIKQMT